MLFSTLKIYTLCLTKKRYILSSSTPTISFTDDDDNMSLQWLDEFSITKAVSAKALGDIIASPNGYLIRPYVKLQSQEKGFQWSPTERGHWSSFMNKTQRNFTFLNSGKIFRPFLH